MTSPNGGPESGTNLQLIVCIVQRGKADDLVKAAQAAGAAAATIFFARGTGIRERLGLLRVVISPEKEVIHIVVPNEDCDRVFDALIKAGDLETPGKGFIYATPVTRALMHGQIVEED